MFSDNIKVLRIMKGLKQKDLADALGVNQRTVSAWENNICEPNIKALLRLKDYFKVSLDDLVDGDFLSSIISGDTDI